MAGAAVVIVGGAIIGSMTAYFLRELGHTGPITVLERDPTYQHSSTALSAASIRTQFGCPINVRMSLFGIAFLRSLPQICGPEADIGLRERGYLVLGGPGSAAARRAAAAMQCAEGAEIAALSPAALAARFPWIDVSGIDIATLGTANEGWFDAWALLQLIRAAARARGALYRHDEATGFTTTGDRVTGVRLASGEHVPADWVVNAAGPASGRLAALLGVALPVSPRKRTVFHVKADLDGAAMPMLFDTSGAWLRPEGEGFLCGIVPPGDDPDATGDFVPDHALFEAVLWPALAARIPALERLRILRAWAGHYEVNALDHNGVVGPVDTLENFVLATGFSGHGVMHSPATGRAVAEWILHGAYRALDLAPLGYERIRAGVPMPETIIY